MRYYLKDINDYKINEVVRINKDNNKEYHYYLIRKFQYFDKVTHNKETVDISSSTVDGLLDKCKKLRNYMPRLDNVIKSNTLFSIICDEWLNLDRDLIVQEESIYVYKGRIEKYYKPYFEGKTIGDITKEDILKFIKFLKDKDLALSTIREITNELKAICEYAYKNHYTRYNLFRGVTLPKYSKITSVPPFSFEEQTKLYKIFENDIYGDFYLVLMEGGMRVRELLGATIHNFDESHMNLYIDRQLSEKKDKNTLSYCHKMRTKNSQNYYCNLIESTCLVIKRVIKEGKEKNLSDNYNNYLNTIFTDNYGNPLNYRNVERHFREILQEIGRPDASIHTLRKTFACNLYLSCFDLDTVRKALNHLNLATTEHYLGPMAQPNQETFEYYDELINKIKNEEYDLIDHNMNYYVPPVINIEEKNNI